MMEAFSTGSLSRVRGSLDMRGDASTCGMISPDDLHRLLQDAGALQLVDVRTSEEFGEVHVGAASNLPLDRIQRGGVTGDFEWAKEEPVYILCRSGRRAMTAAGEFAAAGFREVLIVEGGIQGWIEAGFPVIEEGSPVAGARASNPLNRRA